MTIDNQASMKHLRDLIRKLEELEEGMDMFRSGSSYQLEAKEQARIPAKVKELQQAELVLRMQLIRLLSNWQ